MVQSVGAGQIGCESKHSVVLSDIEVSNEIEAQVRELGISINKINEKSVVSKLNLQDASNFQQRLKELKISFNRTSSFVQANYKKDEKEKLKAEYNKTKTIWDYIVFNFPI